MSPHALRIDCKPNNVKPKASKDSVALLCFVFMLGSCAPVLGNLMNKRFHLMATHAGSTSGSDFQFSSAALGRVPSNKQQIGSTQLWSGPSVARLQVKGHGRLWLSFIHKRECEGEEALQR